MLYKKNYKTLSNDFIPLMMILIEEKVIKVIFIDRNPNIFLTNQIFRSI